MNAEQLDTTLNQFSAEIAEDCRMDQLNVKEKVSLLPSMRHKWVARLIRAKRDILQLHRKKKEMIESAIAFAKERKHVVDMSERALHASISRQSVIIDIEQQIANIEVIVEYLEKVEKIFHAMGHDARNLIELIKMETM